MIYLVDIEPVETRYTAQWKSHIPRLLEHHGHLVTVISGPSDIPAATTPGAFLNFGGTNIYKARQVETIGRLFCNGSIKAGDQFIFTDAWHPGIINLKYMSELLKIPIAIHGLWHAGSYDPQDFLGRLIGGVPWVRHAEKSMFHCIDYNYFATDFHIEMFIRNQYGFENPWIEDDVSDAVSGTNPKIIRSGWPMEYMSDILEPYTTLEKENIVLFPHRIAPEKQPEIFRDLAKSFPNYQFVVCQDQQLSKHEYHTLLGKSKLVFSANLQETLGISWYEGALVGAIPMMPNRLSYSEMAMKEFLYPNEWTESWESYTKHKDQIVAQIDHYIKNFDRYRDLVKQQAQELTDKFFSADVLLDNLNKQML